MKPSKHTLGEGTVRSKVVPVIAAVLFILGLVSPYIPEIHIGKQDDTVQPIPVPPKPKSDVWSGAKTMLLLKADGFAKAADKVDKSEFATDYDLQEYLKAMNEASAETAAGPLMERANKVLCDISVTSDTDRPKISQFLRVISKEYKEAADE